jgi:hypothetical protein
MQGLVLFVWIFGVQAARRRVLGFTCFPIWKSRSAAPDGEQIL